MKRIGVGVIGWGFMGRTHTHSLRAIPLFYQGLDFEPVLAGVCSRRLDQAEEARRQLGFGFATDDEKAMFAKLTSVSGVGPKIAIAILSGSSIAELSMSIAGGDAKRISAIKGVGKKTAEKICVELRDKVSEFAFSGRGGDRNVAAPIAKDAVAALRALGFNEETSSKMVADVLAKNSGIDSVETIIKLALSGRSK